MYIQVKLRLLLILLCSVVISQYGQAKETLTKKSASIAQSYIETDSYKIYLKDECPLYVTICDKVTFSLVNKKNKKKITLIGTTDNEGWRYDFKGYSFFKGKYHYQLTPLINSKNNDDFNKDTDWVFIITDDYDHQILKEVGQWSYDEWGYDRDNYWETDTYKILYLSADCPSDSIDCQNIYFQVINKKNQRQITVKAIEEHPPPSYNLYGYTFNSGALYYIIAYFPSEQFLDVSFKKGRHGILHEKIIGNTVDGE